VEAHKPCVPNAKGCIAPTLRLRSVEGVCSCDCSLAEQLQHPLRVLIGLHQHRGAGLQHDLIAGVLHHLICHVRVPDHRLRPDHVLVGNTQVVEVALQTVRLEGPHLTPERVNLLQRLVDHPDRVRGLVRLQDVDVLERVESGLVRDGLARLSEAVQCLLHRLSLTGGEVARLAALGERDLLAGVNDRLALNGLAPTCSARVEACVMFTS
jgi:hypothetical protein